MARALTETVPGSRVFFITGATDGIGKHTAMKLASDGHSLLVHGRRGSHEGAMLVNDLKERGAADAVYLQSDLSDLKQVHELVQAATATLSSGIGSQTSLVAQGHLDVLVNNAGVFDPPSVESPQGYDTTWAVNVLAPFVITHGLLPLLSASASKGRAPRVVTTSSISQSYRLPDDLTGYGTPSSSAFSSAHSSYSASKLGDRLFTAALAHKLLDSLNESLRAVRCLTMDPGTVNTKMLLAGWGPCGIPVSRADNTYKLAATSAGEDVPSGSYAFGGAGSPDAQDSHKLSALWALLEKQTGCRYAEALAQPPKKGPTQSTP